MEGRARWREIGFEQNVENAEERERAVVESVRFAM